MVEETKGRLGGLNEENLKRCLGMFAWLSIIEVYGLKTETAGFESSSTLGDLKTIFELIIFKQYNYHCVCTPYVKNQEMLYFIALADQVSLNSFQMKRSLP